MLRLMSVAFGAALLWGAQPPDEIPAEDGLSPRFPSRLGAPADEAPLHNPRPKPPAPVATLGGDNPCDGVAPEAQLSCPLTGRVVAVEPITQGVRLVVRKGPPANQLRAQLICQMSQAAAEPDRPPACSFLDADMNLVVRVQNRTTTAVELLPSPPDEARLGMLQQRVESAFPGARKAKR
jgi:hypothetical protein